MTTEYSIQKMVSDGTLSTIALGIQYLQRNDIYIRIAGEETPQSGAPSGYTWSFVNNTTLKILPVVPIGVEVVVYRRTDVDAMYNIYSQNAQFDEATIDENNQQLLYIAQEYLEQGIPGAGVDTIEFLRDDGSSTYYRIKRTDGSYSEEFTVPSASSITKILAREALRRSYAEAELRMVDGSFKGGGTLNTATEVLLYEAEGNAYRWDGALPKVVPVNSTPATTGGISNAAWVEVSASSLRGDLASGIGDTLVRGMAAYPWAVIRTQREFNDDTMVSVLNWVDIGDVDDTVAIDRAIGAIAASGLNKSLYFPKIARNYVYNGTGLNLPIGTSIVFENNLTVIDASNNTNSGYLITINGFRAKCVGGHIRGNPNNPSLKGVSSYYNTENAGVMDIIIEDFRHSLDIDRSWYSIFENIRFRTTSPAVSLTGAYIRIGFNYPELEVNNINFRNIWMSENQMHSVAVYCRTQSLSWLGCSFETKGGPRIKFYTATPSNSFSLHGCYIEGDCGPDKTYFLEAQGVDQAVSLYDCLVRLGPTAGVFAKNAKIVFGPGNFGNSPNVTLSTSDSVTVSDCATGLPYFGGGNSPYALTGLWSGSALNNEAIQLGQRVQPIQEANALIGPYVHFHRHTSTSPVAIFNAFIPASTYSHARIMLLEISAAIKGLSEPYIQGLEKYMVTITLPEATGVPGSGVHVAKILSSAKDNADLLASSAFTVVQNGYDAATDATKFTIYHQVANATRLGDVVYTLTGNYMQNGLSRTTKPWKIQKL